MNADLEHMFHVLRYWQRKAAETDLQLSRDSSIEARLNILEGKEIHEQLMLNYLFRGV